MSSLPPWLQQLLPILILLAAISLVIARLPKVELGHTEAFKRRRFFNWFPLGMTYAFLYMGRYNLNEATSALKGHTSNADFGTIFFWGTLTYGFAFLLNGPLTDKLGGRKTILISAAGSAVCNVLMGAVVYAVLQNGWQPPGGLVATLSFLYALNMYFQSFGAVSIVKVNASWFHVKERGQLGGVFGILISLGVYFAYDWSRFIAKAAPTWWVFFVPAVILAVFLVVDFFVIRDTPSHTGHPDFDTADASSGDTGPQLAPREVFMKMIRNPIILTILGVEFCSGFMRNAIMQWYPKFAKATGIADTFVASNWGMLLCVAGITGGMFAGLISDRVFDSRRGPVSAVLYAGMCLGAVVSLFVLQTPALGWTVIFMSLCVIGVHGMLSGTASMDFGGKKNAGLAVGIIDGAVYAGTALQSLLLGRILPSGDAAKDMANWSNWPIALLPLSFLGLLLATRVWNARPQPKGVPVAPAVAVAPSNQQGAGRTGTEG
ncbi:MFS transporter [Archangium violaceum]|uniref:Major facilitator transporter n=1 Tax=Archangium violaceum Cb vi76 TaxID=1406225 RepID=A0A084SP35_9BACT|nr:MFS transporter [Archangium violaceum]KFA90220.1 major facilitator transporter [Archangium violaceum Cb vi76]